MAAQSKAWVCGRSLAGIAGPIPAGSVDVSRECCVLSGRGLCVRMIPTKCGMSECDGEASIMRKKWSTGSYCAMGRKRINLISNLLKYEK